MRDQIEALKVAVAAQTEAIAAIIAKMDAMNADATLAADLAALTEIVRAQTAVLMERAA
jgi:hypothetical protein